VQRRPLEDECQGPPWHGASQQLERVDSHERLEFAVDGVEVRRHVIVVVQRDDDAEELTDPGHDPGQGNRRARLTRVTALVSG
jgi:hypothetical protein